MEDNGAGKCHEWAAAWAKKHPGSKVVGVFFGMSFKWDKDKANAHSFVVLGDLAIDPTGCQFPSIKERFGSNPVICNLEEYKPLIERAVVDHVEDMINYSFAWHYCQYDDVRIEEV